MNLSVDGQFLIDATPNGNKLVATFDGYITASGEIKTYGPLLSRSFAMLALLEKALPIVKAYAEQRDQEIADIGHPAWPNPMRELADAISAEIDRARGKTDPELCPHGYGFVEYCEDCKGKEAESDVN